MEESLRSVRVTFYLFIAACAAISVLAISSGGGPDWDAKLRDLRLIREAIRKPEGQVLGARRDSVIEREVGTLKTLREVGAHLGIAISPKIRPSDLVPFDNPNERPIEGEVQRVVQTGGPFIDGPPNGVVESQDASPRLRDVHRIITRPEAVRVFRPDDLAGELTAFLRPFRHLGATLDEVRGGGISGPGRPTLERYFDLSIPASAMRDSASRIHAEMQALPFEPRIITTTSPPRVTVDVRIHGQYAAVDERGRMQLWPFVELAKLPTRLLPLINEMGTMTVDGAIAQTQRDQEAESRAQKLSLFGLEIAARKAFVVGPAVLLALGLYMLAQLRSILLESPAHGAAVREFPWIPLSEDPLSRWMSALILGAWPAVALGWLLAFGWTASRAYVALGGALAAGAVLSAVLVLHAARALRRRAAAMAPPSPGVPSRYAPE